MRGVLVLPCLALLGIAPVQQEQLPERHSFGFACGFPTNPPETLRQWRQRADMVLRVRIERHTAFEHNRSSGDYDVVTALDATVLDVVKGHVRGVAEGASQQIFQMGGRLRRPDHTEVVTWNGFDILPIGSEWVLFLEWNPRMDGFTFFYRELGAVEIKDGKVVADGHHAKWNGREVEEFLQAARR